MRLIPVLDVRNGVVVRGVGGRRSEYRPIVSRLTSSTAPLGVARALVDSFHPRELYLADLDAIGGETPAFDVYRGIRELGVRLWVDAGVHDAVAAKRVVDAGCDVVAGLETVASPEVLGDITALIGAHRLVFSLDLRDGVPLREWPGCGGRTPILPGDAGQDRNPVTTPEAIAGAAVARGVMRLIVLDLARVGVGAGTGTEELCRKIASTYPHVEVIAGGGVAGPDDLKRLEACGVRGVLVASALHDGRVRPIRNAE
jgi:phosphoribosylformimino-5-aminoimidazole carboxamide ribotide isomerase